MWVIVHMRVVVDTSMLSVAKYIKFKVLYTYDIPSPCVSFTLLHIVPLKATDDVRPFC